MHRRRATKRTAKVQRPKASKTRNLPLAVTSSDDRQRELIKRLRRERRQLLRLQAASAEVLKVIGSSRYGETKSVFEAMLANAMRICEAKFGHILLYDGERFHAAHLHDVPASYRAFWEQHGPIRPSPNTGLGRLVQTKQIAHIPDLKAHSAYAQREPLRVVTVDQAGARSFLCVPMLKENELIGAIVIYRQEVKPFTEKQIDLVKTFADQAVIAIENARLFNETREALERQTATADILKVIASSPSNVQPIFEAIAERSNRLVNALSTTVFSLVDGTLYLQAFTPTTPEADATLQATFPAQLSTFSWGESIGKGEIYRVIDAEEESERLRDLARKRGWRSCLCVPLVRDGKPIGMIGPTRAEPGPFAEHHVQLMQTFADQAVIAIGNVHLFDEVQAKTRDLEEALRHQTGSANILRVIASSPTDVNPVLQAIVESACDLCNAYDAMVRLKDQSGLALSAHHGPLQVSMESLPVTEDSTAGLAVLDQKPVHVHDMISSEGERFSEAQERARRFGVRTVLTVPLLREGESIGAIMLRRRELSPFDDKQIALLQTFADQAVIALGNVRLFNEVQARTRDLQDSLQQQIATSEVLQVISSSPGELKPVFATMLENATRICGANFGTMYRYDGAFHLMASHNAPQALVEARTRTPVHLPPPDTGLGRLERTRQIVHIYDITTEPGYAVNHAYITGSKLSGARTILLVPLLKDTELVGSINIFRKEVHPFADKQIELLSNFAKQAVIAIENARLLKELRQRTNDLSKSLDDLRTAQDRLIQTEKLASLGQLTAGIAHEIKNPLNFVNNFSALSAELLDEMNEMLADAVIEAKKREELDEVRELLKSNLDKVVQHGKRADSIVKNMLLHSRQGAGERRPADINALVDESLNLAYHGARAEKTDFNIALERDFDPGAGIADIYPQEITRVLLNVISNGFYAAIRRASEIGNGFEPKLWAATKDLGQTVEIRLRDNGTGIPDEVRDEIFNPFFTTKPAGEGTGLGLSMSHDIVVKQHGGTIEVETEVGAFTEFRIVLPRTVTLRTKSGEQE